MKSVFRLLGAVFFVLVLIQQPGCTKNDEQQANEVEEKGKIDQMTDKAAEQAVKKIRTPLDKARSTQSLGDDRVEEMDKALKR